ncbi:MAG: hypothetical protein EXR79_00405 [Myxococcales bacterium]|nr:hypothetical protein [Myxococcales bacterium]
MTSLLAPTPAATVILLRDAPAGVEVFLMRRHAASGFMAGATVFPGGKVDAEDRAAPATGRSVASCAAALGAADDREAWAHFVAAARELHEESHVLLALHADGRPVGPDDVAELDADIEAARTGHRLASAAWHAAALRRRLVPNLAALIPFARWVTPRAEPRRFDAFFFLAALPRGQVARLDPHEASSAHWTTPAAALADHESGGPIWLPPPTLHTLTVLRRAGDTAAAIVAAFDTPGDLALYLPEFLADTPDGPAIVLPGDSQHSDRNTADSSRSVYARLARDAATRYVLRDGRFAPSGPPARP